MPNPWFRLYSEFAHDPKVRTMPEAQQLHLVLLFCMRCEGKPLGKYTDEEIAYYLKLTPLEAGLTKQFLIEKGFIDDKWNVTHWDKRQFLSDSSTERVRRYRQARKQEGTLHETHETENVTVPDTDIDTEEPSPAAKKTAARRTRKKQASPPTKTDFAKTRHAEFKVAIFEYWKSKNPDIDCPWAAPEGMQLEMWLRASPNVTIAQFKNMLRNRYRSPVNHATRPSVWLKNVSCWANGLADDYGKLVKGNGHTNGNGVPKPPTQYEIARDEQLAERRTLLEKV